MDDLYRTEYDTSVPSPCVGVCTMDPDTGYCFGCFRTLDEIADWGTLTRERKLAIMSDLPQREDRDDSSTSSDRDEEGTATS